MKESEEITVDNNLEFEKQRRQDILKGNYARIECIIPEEDLEERGSKMPYIQFELKNVSGIEIAYLYKSLQQLEKEIEDRFPGSVLYSNFSLGVHNLGSINKDSKEK